MRVLILNDYEEPVGGAQVHDRYVKSVLASRGHDVKYFAGTDTTKMRNFSRTLFSLDDWVSLKSVLDWNPDVVYSHSLGDTLSPILLREVKNRGTPTVLKIPDLYSYRFNSLDRDNVLGSLDNVRIFCHRRWIRRYVDLLLCPSTTAKKWAAQNFPEIPRKIHRNPMMCSPTTDVQISKREMEILFVGRLHWGKDVPTLLEALALLGDTDWHASIIGSGPRRRDLEQLATELRIDSRIHFVGQLKRGAVIERYKNADVTVLPSIVPETFGLTLIESMSQGTPCITTNIGAQRELVADGRTGFLVPPQSPEKLKGCLSLLLTDTNRRKRMSNEARSFAESYQKTDRIEELVTVFRSLQT